MRILKLEVKEHPYYPRLQGECSKVESQTTYLKSRGWTRSLKGWYHLRLRHSADFIVLSLEEASNQQSYWVAQERGFIKSRSQRRAET